METEKRKVPKLRFPGFTEDWEQRKLEDVVTINPPSTVPEEFKYVDLESVVGTNLINTRLERRESAPSRAQRLAQKGDLFYQTVRPYQKNNYLYDKDDTDYVFSTGYAQLRGELDGSFLLSLLQTNNFVNQVLDKCTGTSYPAINSTDLGSVLIQIPQKTDECKYIGLFLEHVENLITLHQRKLKVLLYLDFS